MAHIEQREFIEQVKAKYPKYFKDSKVLEFGSLNINGTVRDYFENCNYIGVDLAEGNCVDVISTCKDFRSEALFDIVISCEMLEHDNTWMESLINMYSLCKVGGLILITCATTGRSEHGTIATSPMDSPFTNDYYRNIEIKDITSVWKLTKRFSKFSIQTNDHSHDLQFWGVKK